MSRTWHQPRGNSRDWGCLGWGLKGRLFLLSKPNWHRLTMNITFRGVCSLTWSRESSMWFRNLCIPICSILRTFTSQNMGEELETTGVKDTVRLSSCRTKSSKWSIERLTVATRLRGFSYVTPLRGEREADSALTCLRGSMTIIQRRSFRLTLCFPTAMMSLCSLITVFCRSKDWLWMLTQWLCWTTRRWIGLR